MRTLPPRRWSRVNAINLAAVAILIRTTSSFSIARVGSRGRRPLRPPVATSSKSDHDTTAPLIHPSLDLLDSFTSHTAHIQIPPDQRVQAYCLSDLHADGDNANVAWLRDKCRPAATIDDDDAYYSILIVPGDLANSIPSIRRCFRILVSNWDAVCYCVGNHEAWVKEKESTEEDLNDDDEDSSSNEEEEASTERTSVDQLVDVLTVAKEEGVHVGPVCVTYSQKEKPQLLWMVPLQSFYHSSWDTEPDLHHPALLAAEQRRSFRQRWNDYRNMKWPQDLTSHVEFTEGDNGKGGSETLARAFSDLNQKIVTELSRTNGTILSYSHYVPRVELSIEKRFLIDPRLARVIGSEWLERDVRKLQPNLHLFGHTHIPIGMEVDDIRYAQWPLGYPKEATLQCRTVAATGPMLVFDSVKGGVPSRVAAEDSHWSRHYHQFDRDPSNLEPAPWLRDRLERIGRRRR